MPQARRRKRNGRNPRQRAIARRKITPLPEEPEPVRGVKLRTVSAFTMAFAVMCLCAFLAGRPPVSLAGPAESVASAQNEADRKPLRQDDTRAFLERSLGKRESRAKKSEKGPR